MDCLFGLKGALRQGASNDCNGTMMNYGPVAQNWGVSLNEDVGGMDLLLLRTVTEINSTVAVSHAVTCR